MAKVVVSIICGLLGVLFVVLGLVLGFAIFPNIIEEEINKQVVLEDGTEQYERFVELPFPLTFKVYLFEVTNPAEVMTGAAPAVEERGPYVYKQYRRKVDVNLTENDVEYLQYQLYEFDALHSFPYKEDDTITVLNAALQGVLQITEMDSTLLLRSLNTALPEVFVDTPDTLFHQVKIKDILFNGYRFCTDLENVNPRTRTVCKTIRKKKSNTMIVNADDSVTFSFFGFKNENHDGPYLVDTGKEDVKNLGNIKLWNNTKYLFNNCNEILGTDSSIFPPHNTEDTVFDVFNTDICRSVKLPFDSEIEYEGIPGYRNVMARDTFNGPASTPENSCFCVNKTRTLDGEVGCHPDGFYDLYYCQKAPVLLSQPHFLWGDESYASTVDGLGPDEDRHRTYVDYEPNTGTPLRGAKRVQFNMIIRPIVKIERTAHVKPAVVPLLWVEEGVELPTTLVDQLNDQFFSKLVLVDIVQWVLVALGVVIILVTLIVFFVLLFRKK